MYYFCIVVIEFSDLFLFILNHLEQPWLCREAATETNRLAGMSRQFEKDCVPSQRSWPSARPTLRSPVNPSASSTQWHVMTSSMLLLTIMFHAVHHALHSTPSYSSCQMMQLPIWILLKYNAQCTLHIAHVHVIMQYVPLAHTMLYKLWA